MSIQVEYENGLSYIVIINDLAGSSYTYINPRYKDDASQVEIGGSTVSKKFACDDKLVILDIITVFLTTGQPCSRYEWLERKE